jgi:hypothetical protein
MSDYYYLKTKAVEIEIDVYIIEPGDHTKYEFIVYSSLSMSEKDYVSVTGGVNTRFNGYSLDSKEIEKFFADFGKPIHKGQYQNWGKIAIESSPFLEYVRIHTGNCNVWTALAAIVACGVYLKIIDFDR